MLASKLTHQPCTYSILAYMRSLAPGFWWFPLLMAFCNVSKVTENFTSAPKSVIELTMEVGWIFTASTLLAVFVLFRMKEGASCTCVEIIRELSDESRPESQLAEYCSAIVQALSAHTSNKKVFEPYIEFIQTLSTALYVWSLRLLPLSIGLGWFAESYLGLPRDVAFVCTMISILFFGVLLFGYFLPPFSGDAIVKHGRVDVCEVAAVALQKLARDASMKKSDADKDIMKSALPALETALKAWPRSDLIAAAIREISKTQ